jgi:hypothetical protein
MHYNPIAAASGVRGVCYPPSRMCANTACCPFGYTCYNNRCYSNNLIGPAGACEQMCGQQYPNVDQVEQYQKCLAGCGPVRSQPVQPQVVVQQAPTTPRGRTPGFGSQRRAQRRAQRAATLAARSTNPVLPWVVGGVALAGAGLYGAARCAPGIRHQERAQHTIEGLTLDVTRTLEYKGCFQERPWVATVVGTMSDPSTGESQGIDYRQAFDDKDAAMAWLYPDVLDEAEQKAANPSATARAAMARRKRNPKKDGKQPKGISLKKSPGDMMRNWFFLSDKDRPKRMAKYDKKKYVEHARPPGLSTRRLAN